MPLRINFGVVMTRKKERGPFIHLTWGGLEELEDTKGDSKEGQNIQWPKDLNTHKDKQYTTNTTQKAKDRATLMFLNVISRNIILFCNIMASVA